MALLLIALFSLIAPSLGLRAHRDVDIVSTLMGGSQESTPVRAPVHVLAGIVNNGDDNLNVTSLFGFVMDPSNSMRVYANLSATKLSTAVEPGGEASLEFPFTLDLELPHYPFPLRVAVSALYHDDRKNKYQHTVFNETLLFTAPHAAANVSGILFNTITWVVVIGAAMLLPVAAPSLRKAFKNVPALNGLAPGAAAAAATSGPAASGKAKDAADDVDFGGLRKAQGGAAKQRK